MAPGISGTLAFDPSQLNLNPSANSLGTQLPGMPQSNPFQPISTPGTNLAPVTSPSSSPAPYSGATSALAGLNPAALNGLLGNSQGNGQYGKDGYPTGTIGGANFGDIGTGFSTAGYKYGIANALTQFLYNGAGFNPAVAQSLIAAMQPQFDKGRANLMEQFGSHGLAMGSPAALGLGDYQAQNNLDVGTLLAGLYTQSVNNYMNVLLQGRGPAQTYGTGPGTSQGAANLSGIMDLISGVAGGSGGGVLGTLLKGIGL